MNENEIIINEEVMEEVIDLVPEKPGVNFGKIGFGILVAGAVAALGYKAFKLVQAKKSKGSQEVEEPVLAVDQDFDYAELSDK